MKEPRSTHMPGKFNFLIIGASRGGVSNLATLLALNENLHVHHDRHLEHLVGLVPETAATVDARMDGFRAACDKDAEEASGLVGNTVTVNHIGALTGERVDDDEGAIARFASYFHALKLIVVVRDGRTCVRSLLLRDGASIDDACRIWLFSVKVFRFFQSEHANRKIVRFEDLISDPAQTLQDICDFLGVEYSAGMLKGMDAVGQPPGHRVHDFDTPEIEPSHLPVRALRCIQEGLAASGYISETVIHQVAGEDSELAELREELAFSAKQLSYQISRRRSEVVQVVERELFATNRHLQRLTDELADREKRLVTADADLRRLMSLIEDRNQRLVEADRDLRRLTGMAEERQGRLVAADADLRRLVGALEDRDNRLVQADADLRRLMSQLDEERKRHEGRSEPG